MKEVTIIHSNRCSKSREAMQLLQDKGIEPHIRYYLEDPLNQRELKELLKKLGIKAEELVRKKESLYKEEYADKKLNNAEWIRVLSKNPVLIERPVVVVGDRAVIGRPTERILELL